MVKVKAFKGYLCNKEIALKVLAKPYDVLNTQEARELAEGNPMSFYHVNKPEMDLPDDIQDKSLIYTKGRENLLKFIQEGYLVEDTEERIYIYGQRMGTHQQYGILALSSIDDYEHNIIKKHELTLPDKELDRTNLCDVQSSNAEPVFLAFRENKTLEDLIQEVVKQEPYSSVITEDEFEHTLWLASKEVSL